VRAAAKNHPSVAVVVDPACYGDIAEAVAQGGFDLAQRRQLAATAFKHTADYDVAVSGWFAQQLADDSVASAELEGDALRYGENPHQQASIVREGTTGVANAKQLHGKEMSYNNYQDADAAWRAAWDHARTCVAIIKQADPCVIADSDASIAAAHAAAHACDPMSSFGGAIAVNREVAKEMAPQVAVIFTELIIAPSYEDGADEIL